VRVMLRLVSLVLFTIGKKKKNLLRKRREKERKGRKRVQRRQAIPVTEDRQDNFMTKLRRTTHDNNIVRISCLPVITYHLSSDNYSGIFFPPKKCLRLCEGTYSYLNVLHFALLLEHTACDMS